MDVTTVRSPIALCSLSVKVPAAVNVNIYDVEMTIFGYKLGWKLSAVEHRH